MDQGVISKKAFLASLLLRLYHDEVTGVISIKDHRRSLEISIQGGHIVSAGGIDKESMLLKEVARKRGLDQARFSELQALKERDPESFGRALIEGRLISDAVWRRFLEIKLKAILAVAFEMEAPDLGFNKTEVNIPAILSVDLNTPQVILETLREMKEDASLYKRVFSEKVILARTPEAESMKGRLPLNSSEQTVFSLIDGKKTVGVICTITGIGIEPVRKTLFLIHCVGLIQTVTAEEEGKGSRSHYAEIINLYLDLLGIIETHFKKEVGKEFDRILSKCKEELVGQSRELFHELRLSKDAHAVDAEEILKRFTGQSKAAEGRLMLLSSFNKLLYLLIMRMKKVLGKGLTENTLSEMMNVLQYVEKYREDAQTMNYVRGNLEDYLRQIKS